MNSFRVVILSAVTRNLKGAVLSVLEREPSLQPSDIIVVDDGAKAHWKPDLPQVTWIPGAKPFIFARNANLGFFAAGDSDVVLMNDDARLKTQEGFSKLSALASENPRVGVLSAAIEGFIGNPEQSPKGVGLREDKRVVAFVCVYIPRTVYLKVGTLDEQFTGYGGEDMDYCDRAMKAGLTLGIADQCVVSHGEVPSTYRTRPDFKKLFDEGLAVWRRKKGIK
ncbi:MAG TPA: galactosyltransferase-related protein [Planctomycetota bacterium]|nr:galactosyltransferase-related protein [Planctomycetota bacterium]